MASLADVFKDKERINWLRAWLAIDIAKSGLEHLADNEAQNIHQHIYSLVGSTCNSCSTANVLNKKPCPMHICDNVCQLIVAYEHRYNSWSWNNTSAQFWSTNYWEIAKCYFPSVGYAATSSIQDTDFYGIVSFMLNCRRFDSKFSFPITTGKPTTRRPACLLYKAVRRSSTMKVTDVDLQDYFTTLNNLLSDPRYLSHDSDAQNAVMKLAQLSQRSNLADAAESQPLTSQASAQAPVARETFNSRFREDFTVIKVLGKGAFGVVFEAKNKWDFQHYAVKRIKGKGKDVSPEVRALARLVHPYIVRYYQAWMETPPQGWQAEQDSHIEGLSCLTCTDEYSTETTDVFVDNVRQHVKASESSVPDSFHWSTDTRSSIDTSSRDTKDDDYENEEDEDENENDGNKGWKDDEWQENKNNDEDDDGIVFESSEASKKRKTDEVKKKAENNNDDTTEGGESIDYRLHQRLQQLSINIHSLPVPPTFLYIQTELCKAETLKDWLDKTKIRLPGVISRILREITSALAYIHEKEYIHRDLKPANIFFAALDNSVKLGDFGLAKIMAEDHVGSLDAGKVAKSFTAGVGTFLYMSPEQRRKKYTNKVDIFALGVILFEMFHSFDSGSERLIMLEAARGLNFPEPFQVDHVQWCDTVRQMLSTEPDDRPTAQQLLDSDLLRS